MTESLFSRRQIREKALQALFPLEINTDLAQKDAIYDALKLDYEKLTHDELVSAIPLYLQLLVEGVGAKKDQIDDRITKHLGSGWPLDRLSKIDVIILRIAIFEMLYVGEVPNTVALDEAIELTKKYSDDQSRRFVNGILSNIMKEIEAA